MDRISQHFTGGSDQNHYQEKEMRKGKMAVWGGLTNRSEKKRRERQRRKGKIHVSEGGFQRIARRDKKAFLSDQCKEIEENKRMGKARISSKNLEIPRNISCKDEHNKGQKWYGPNRSRRY